MNKDIIHGNWKQVKGKLKAQWGKLTDDEITKMKGSFEELSGILQERYGYNKEAASKQISDFVEKNKWE